MGCMVSGTALPYATDDQRAKPIGDRQRKPLPGRDEQPVFRIERIVVGYRGAGPKPESVQQRLRRETPVLLEGKRTRADLAAAEVECPAAACSSAAHHLPIH